MIIFTNYLMPIVGWRTLQTLCKVRWLGISRHQLGINWALDVYYECSLAVHLLAFKCWHFLCICCAFGEHFGQLFAS